MKAFIIACILSLAYGEEVQRGYHENIGIPAAARVRQREALGSRIYGGSNSNYGEQPYMAGLLVNLTIGLTSLCGGTLLKNTKVLTAAHCYYDGYYQGSAILVVLGTKKVYSGGVRVYATEISWPSSFDPYVYIDDIAMLTIPYVAYTSYIAPIPLPRGPIANSDFASERALIIGFGSSNDIPTINENQNLQKVYVTVLNNTECQSYYDELITPKIMCTRGYDYVRYGPCSGDSGGPVVTRAAASVQDVLIGIVSFTSRNGCTTASPVGNTRVTAYRNWIESLL